MLKKFDYFRLAWLLLFSFFFLLMLRITLNYIPFGSEVSFLLIKQTEVVTVKPYLFIFYLHVYTAIFCLIAGFTQFSNALLTKYRKLHRVIGYLYFIVVVFFAGPSGVVIGYYANGGIYAQLSFMLLGILWIFFTIKAISAIRRKKSNFIVSLW